MNAPGILIFAGSARRDSANRKLALTAADAVTEAGGAATLLELSDHPLPLYDGDLEARDGLPETAQRLKKTFLQHDGLLIVSPEYNSSITPLLKNTIDWVSRSAPGEGSLACYRGKSAALLAASPGGLGGLRGLVHLRSILGSIGVHVLPDQLAISRAHEAFDENGALRDAKQRESLARIAASLVALTRALVSSRREESR